MGGVTRAADLPVDSSSPIAEPGARLAARTLDALFPALPQLVCVPLGALLGSAAIVQAAFWLGIAATVVLFGIDLFLLHRFGQTIGKRLLGLRIVRADGSRAGLLRLFFVRTLLPGVVGIVPVLGWAASLADALAIFSSERRTIHDHLADTIVIDLRAPAK